MTMPVSFHLRQQDQEEVPGQVAEDAHRDDIPAPEPEIQRSPAPQMSPPSPPQQSQQIHPAHPIQHTIRRSTFMPARERQLV